MRIQQKKSAMPVPKRNGSGYNEDWVPDSNENQLKMSGPWLPVMFSVLVLGFVIYATCWLSIDTLRRRKKARIRQTDVTNAQYDATNMEFQKPELDNTAIVLVEAMDKESGELEVVENARVELEVIEKVELEALEKEKVELEVAERIQEASESPTTLSRLNTDVIYVELPGSPESWICEKE